MPAASELDPYATAFLDWLGCAVRGSSEQVARIAAASGDRVLALGTAGHVLDYDDTYAPGLAHLSAPTAPAALVVAAERRASVAELLAAYAAGFEAMAALARASHPALYERGWHPTAVCGVIGAAVAAAQLLGADREQAAAIALLRAGGLQAAFGSAGKALQVGSSASSGVLAARLAAGGARVDERGVIRDFERAYGARHTPPNARERAVDANWIKAWPCCLQTHSAIEAADGARADGVEPQARLRVLVHPISLRAAGHGPSPADGLAAKFSVPYLVAHTLVHGPPRVESFVGVDRQVAALASSEVNVEAEPTLSESEAVLVAAEREYRVKAALGSPERPMTNEQLRAKLRDLAGERLLGLLDDLERPAAELLELF